MSTPPPPPPKELAYRIGTHSSFLSRMLAALSTTTVPIDDQGRTGRPLAALRARALEDRTVALLDAWAVVADVLTFYQERIANEGYLLTATEQRSIVELARTIGYELSPGLAATTSLAFTAEEVPGKQTITTVPRGTRVQSLPGQGELPQTFETDAEIQARSDWNQLRPRRTQPQNLAVYKTAAGTVPVLILADGSMWPPQPPYDEPPISVPQLYLQGTALNLRVGDLLLIQRSPTYPELVLGGPQPDGTIQPDGTGAVAVIIQRVEIDNAAGRTTVTIAAGGDVPPLNPASPLPVASITSDPLILNQESVREPILARTWYEHDLESFLALQRWNPTDLLNQVAVQRAAPPEAVSIFAFRQRVSFFGHNAPLYPTLISAAPGSPYPASDDANWDKAPYRNIFSTSQLQAGAPSYYEDADVFLERSVPEIAAGSWVVFRQGQTLRPFQVISTVEESLADFAMSGRATGLFLQRPNLAPGDTLFPSDKQLAENAGLLVRKTTAYVQSEPMALAPLPINDVAATSVLPLPGTEQSANQLVLDGMVLGLKPGQLIWLRGEQWDAPGVMQDEFATLINSFHAGGYTTLCFSAPLRCAYVRKSLVLNANVALASHGETVVREVLGSGDAAQKSQRFVLRRGDLVYLSAPTQSGAESTVRILVNGIEWDEVPSLTGLDGRSQCYMLRTDDLGRTSVIFGDGENGARLPSGQENVVASYRTGAAMSGELPAGRLTLLQSRPLGIKAVTNPLPTRPDLLPDTLEQARTSATLSVSIIDRAVTLRDYELFAAAFAGVGRAHASLIGDGRGKRIHLTIASEDGTPIPADSPVPKNLLAALSAIKDPLHLVEIDTYDPRYFLVHASVVLDKKAPSYQQLDAASAAVFAAFSFAKRGFGQNVTSAEVIAALQAAPGVLAANVQRMFLVGGASADPLPAQFAHWDFNLQRTVRDELLQLQPTGLILTEIPS